jgi:F-type H+-transporting ATPase subunit delta
MAVRLSRRKIAAYTADKLINGETPQIALKEVAAYLVETKRTREYELIVRDIEEILAARGHVVADVTSAHELSDATRRAVEELVGAGSVQLREIIDPTVLGGIRVAVPGKRFDGTIAHKLTALKQL